ncbi:MAG: hypothetical protein KF749_09800 [Bacteroidetes bacterium]|nr:hypothetical protein [Bacteroidota bacterium]MCW5895040.1 hypothetical protein [Bacteroidota bacterium]
MTRIFVSLLIFMFTLSSMSYGQYFGEQVMEKSFEQTDFFFTPYRFVPFGIGTFKNSISGVLDDPLINLDVNPSYLYHDSVQSSYLYFDFRSAKEIRDWRNTYYPYPMLAVRTIEVASIVPYPRFFINTRRELEPVISAAYLFRPTEGAMKNLSLGLTYQMMSQDEKYYPIPQDIYKSVLGSDYRGVTSSAAENIPIVDKYSGTDNIHQTGHFVSLFAGYELDPDLRVGAKLARVSFDRDGSFGSQNVWDYYYASNSSSLWRNGEARAQSYGHWELIGGVNYSFASKFNVGVNGGYLWGDADQTMARNDSSYYSYGIIGSTTNNWNYWGHSGNQRQTWKHDGKTVLGGLDFKAQVSEKQILQFHYQYTRQNTDISLGGFINDTSFGRSRYQWDTTVYNYTSNYKLFDERSGSGISVGNLHKAVASLQWDISEKVRLSLGAQYESRIVETNTNEAVVANRFSRSSSTGSYPYSYFDSTAESKNLEWNFRTKLTRFTIPVFFTIKTSDKVELIFGLNRSVANWQVDDVTLAIFNYRVQANREGTERRERFGERYTQPQEKVSDTRTTLLAGFTVAPSTVFNLRFLVVPNFVDSYYEGGVELQDLQWWISVNLLP